MKKKILLIEDESVLTRMYKVKLSLAGFKVMTAIDVKDGLKLAKKEKPDLILLDILLPRKNGIVFLEKQQKTPAISSIPVIVFSNYDDIATKKRAAELGVKAYLIKTDHTPEAILRRIRSYLKK